MRRLVVMVSYLVMGLSGNRHAELRRQGGHHIDPGTREESGRQAHLLAAVQLLLALAGMDDGRAREARPRGRDVGGKADGFARLDDPLRRGRRERKRDRRWPG